MGRRRTLVLITTAVAAVAGALAGCSSGGSGGNSLVLYNGQHESTTKILVADFEKATGIHVNVRSGEDPELANQILQEGSRSPADVIYTENSPALALLSEKGKLAKLGASTLANVPAAYDSPRQDWVGVAGREVVLAYNPAKLSPSELPKPLLDVGGPDWHGKVGIAPSDADFQAIVAAVAAAEGDAKTTAWLQNLKRVAQTYDGNTAILQAVNRGDLSAGIIYHYYYFRDQAESGANSGHVKMYYFGVENPGDPGAFVSVSGAAVLKTSHHAKLAERFVKFLSSVQGQEDLAKSDDFEYPLNPKVQANPKLKPFDQLGTPDLGPGEVGDGAEAVKLLQQVGLL